MSDHLLEALRRYEASDYARQDGDQPLLIAIHEAAQAQVQATLEVGEHVENLWDQVRRLADFAEGALELLRERLVIPQALSAELVSEDPRGLGICSVCSTTVLPGQAHASTPDGDLRHGWCHP